MALTKIKTGGLADNSVTDAKVADAITVTGAQTGITSVGTLTSFAVSHSSDFGSFTSTLQSPILKLNSTYGSAAGSGYIDFQRDGTTASRIYQTNQELRFATGGTTDAITIDSSQNSTFGGRINVTEIRGSSVAIKDSNGDLMAWLQDGSSRLYSSAYNLRLEEGNELNFYSGNTVAELFINHSGTGSAVNIADSELQVVKGTGSIFSGKVGIGGSPDTLLNLKDTGGIELRLEADSNNSGQEDCFIRFYTDGKTQEGIVGMDNNNSSTLFSSNTENAMVFGCVSNLPVVFATNNTERMQITSSGKVGIQTSSPNVGAYNDERGVLTISSTDNGSANNYAILELQGHSIANSVGLGGVSFLDHTAQVALIQGERQNNSQSAKLSFYTSETGPSIQRRMTIYDAGHVEVSKTITAEKNSKFELWMNTGDNGRSAALHHDTLKFSVEKFDVNDDTSHVNNKTRFTAPIDGHYYLSFSGNANVSAGGGAVLYFTFHKNGSANALYYYYGMTGGTAAGWKYITGNAVIALSANDYIEVQSRVSGGTHYWDASSSTQWTSFRGFKLT